MANTRRKLCYTGNKWVSELQPLFQKMLIEFDAEVKNAAVTLAEDTG